MRSNERSNQTYKKKLMFEKKNDSEHEIIIKYLTAREQLKKISDFYQWVEPLDVGEWELDMTAKTKTSSPIHRVRTFYGGRNDFEVVGFADLITIFDVQKCYIEAGKVYYDYGKIEKHGPYICSKIQSLEVMIEVKSKRENISDWIQQINFYRDNSWRTREGAEEKYLISCGERISNLDKKRLAGEDIDFIWTPIEKCKKFLEEKEKLIELDAF